MAGKAFSQKALTQALRSLSAEAFTIRDNGDVVTRYQKLAEMIWNQALGFEETVVDDEGNRKKVIHKPVAWCQQYIFERLEGKSAVAVTEDEGRIKASDRVRELAKSRLNSLAVAAAGPEKKGPPKHKPKEKS
jgi:hypothetical protein